MGRRALFWTIVGAIVSVVIAWLLLEFVLRIAFFLVKLVVVAVVALVVFFLLRRLFTRRERTD